VFGIILPWLIVVFGCWVGYQLLRQNGRILLRLEAVEEQLRQIATATDKNNRHQHTGKRSLADSRLNRDGLAVGTRAPDFQLPLLNGETLSLENYRGRKVLLVFSDPECGPCNRLAPTLEQFSRQHPNIQTLMISRGGAEANLRKVAEHGLTFPVALQRQWEISRRYAKFATPVAYLIDEEGIVAAGLAAGAEQIMALLSELSDPAAMIEEKRTELMHQ
jgi:peroxiredoxin